MLFLMAGLPKPIQLEERFGITAAHADVVALVEQYLESGTWGTEVGKPAPACPPRSPTGRRQRTQPC
jgi:hypothetical protein